MQAMVAFIGACAWHEAGTPGPAKPEIMCPGPTLRLVVSWPPGSTTPCASCQGAPFKVKFWVTL